MSLTYELLEPSINGTSTWFKWFGCPRKASQDLQRSPGANLSPGGKGQQVGTLGHAYLSLYHTGTPIVDLPTVQFKAWNQEQAGLWADGSLISEEVKNEALRVVSHWAASHAADFFGVDCQCEFEVSCCKHDLIAEAVTGSRFRSWSGRMDLVARDPASDALTVIDWKFLAALQEGTRLFYEHSIQLKAYMVALEAMGYEVAGGKYVLLIKRKEPHFEIVDVPVPSAREVYMIHKMFDQLENIMRNRSKEINPNECFGAFNNVCPYLINGECSRIPSP